MPQSPIQTAIQQIAQEKNISEDAVLHAIDLALAAAYRKDFGNKMQNIIAEFDTKTGGVKVVDIKTVVEDVPEEELAAIEAEEKEREERKKMPRDERKPDFKSGKDTTAFVADNEEEVKRFNPKTEIQISEAKVIDKGYKLGDEIVTSLEVPGEFGRMAAQTAKQVIIQKLREVERENVYNEYKEIEGQVVNGTVQRREGRNVLVDLEHAVAIMPPEEQMMGEMYNIGNRMKFYLVSVETTNRGPQLVVSRSHSEIVKKIFELEIPEVANDIIEIKSIAREAGHRTKVAIFSTDDSIDPIGSCVGQRGSRIQTIISELNNEKVDIILWDEDDRKFITNSLSPAKIVSVELKEGSEEKNATVTVKEDQLSLAIGRAGQNVRLASKLTGWKINIAPENAPVEKEDEKGDSEEATEDVVEDTKEEKKEETKEEKVKEEKTEAVEEKEEKKEKKETKKKTAKKTTKKKVAKKEKEEDKE